MTARLLLAVTFLLLLAHPGQAQNLFTNSHFDTGLGGWEAGAGTTWDGAMDAAGSPASGSARSTWTFATADSGVVVVSQCVTFPDGEPPHVLSGKIFLPAGQIGGGASLSVGYFAQPDCGGPPVPGTVGITPLVTDTGRWVTTAVTVGLVARSARVWAYLQSSAPGTLTAHFDDITFQPPSETTCVADSTTLCLDALRFKVTATFDTGHGISGNARVQPLTADTGYLWFFDASNVEVVVKVLDGCGLGGHFWVFAGGLTNVKTVITVTDMQTGAVKTYTNPPDSAFKPIQDTSAFACP